MKRFIIPLVVVIFVLTLFITLSIYFLLNNNGKLEERETGESTVEQETTSVKPFAIQESMSIKNSVSGEKTMSSSRALVQLNTSSLAKPNAFQIKATYNQSEVEITNLSIGDIWTDSNILTNSIDASTGTIKFAAGQGFSAQKSEGYTLFMITYTKKNNTNGNIGLVIQPESKFGFSNQSQLQPLNPSLLFVSFE